MRDDFPPKVKELVARRVGYLCSNPECNQLTVGPKQTPEGSINIGVAAHITAASINGPRYNTTITESERRSTSNAIWLCQNCAKLVDADSSYFTVALLLSWKQLAEEKAGIEIKAKKTSRIVTSHPITYKDIPSTNQQEGHPIIYATHIIGS